MYVKRNICYEYTCLAPIRFLAFDRFSFSCSLFPNHLRSRPFILHVLNVILFMQISDCSISFRFVHLLVYIVRKETEAYR